MAAAEGNILIAKALIEAKADVNAQDRWQVTPLRDSVREGHLQVSQLLHDHGGELKFDEAQESIELCEMARQGNIERLKMLLNYGCDGGATGDSQRTALRASRGEVELSRPESL